ncbi:Hypothetical_protein [Hexamita inflata]|uniref:Hypothetical_protein n=1 Tax=Hexamita inflata TaxID=28002 RepID=A0AA86U1P0_9EUKA|nr:Hypothetical protein HINF_LOCUS22592 [Hexamita inflata]
MNNDQGDKPKIVFSALSIMISQVCEFTNIIYIVWPGVYLKIKLKITIVSSTVIKFLFSPKIVIQLGQFRNNLFKSDCRVLIPPSQVNFQNRCFWPLFPFKQLQSS